MSLRFTTAFVLAVCIQFSATSAPPLYQWVVEGKVDSVRSLAESANWSRSPEGELARALVSDDAAMSVAVYRRNANDQQLPASLRAIAWQRLYGYALAIDDRKLANEAVDWLAANRTYSLPLYPDGLPDQVPEKAPEIEPYWAVQIGAFGDRGNATDLAERQRDNGYTAVVGEIESRGRTLYAVWVGSFETRDAATSFGRRVYGSPGRDFTTVEVK